METWIHPNWVALLLMIPAAICGTLAVYGFANRPAPGSRLFSLLMLAILTWSAAYGFELSCSQLGPMLFFVGIEYIGIVSIPPLLIMLILIYTGRERFIRARYIIPLLIIPATTLLLNITNPLHFLYYSRVGVDSTGSLPLLSIEMGPGYVIFLAYYYACILLGTILLLIRLRSPAQMYRQQVIVLLIGIAIPWAANILYAIFNIKPFGHLDLTPFAFALTGAVLAWGILRQHLFDAVPIAHDLVVESMDEGMLILDKRDRVVGCNSAALKLLSRQKIPAGEAISTVLKDWPKLLGLLDSGHEEQSEIVFDLGGARYYLDVMISDLQDRHGQELGRVVLLHDISLRRRAQESLRQQEEKFRTLFNTSRDAIFITTTDGKWLEANEAAARLFGYDNIGELMKQPSSDFYSNPETRMEFASLVAQKGFVDDFPAVLRRSDGSLISARITAVAVRDGNGKVIGYQGTLRDVTQLVKFEEALLDANERLEQMLAESEKRNNEIILLGEMAQWIHGSRDLDTAYAGAARFLRELFPGNSGSLSVVDAETGHVKVKATFGTPRGVSEFQSQDCLSLRQGKIYEYDGSPEKSPCPHLGNFRGYYISMPLLAPGESSWLLSLQDGSDETEPAMTGPEWLAANRPMLVAVGQELMLALANAKLRETLKEQATRDPLTGLYNRRYMEEMLDREMRSSRRSGRGIGFIMCDLDHFKTFNDTYGHETGDTLLKAVANLMRGTIRVEDIACRYGGEEFLIIMPSASLEDAFHRAQEILQAVEKISFEQRGTIISGVTISMGVSSFPDQGKEAADLIAAADAALYKAKREGRNRVCLPG